MLPVWNLPGIDDLRFKGVHNSYDQRRKLTPAAQVDDYGVWAVELDFDVLRPDMRDEIEHEFGAHPAWFTTPAPCVIGHDGPGDCADGAGHPFSGGPDFLLSDQLAELAGCTAGLYRPLFIYFDTHDWDGRENADDWLPRASAEAAAAFGERLFTPPQMRAFRAMNDRTPSIPELAGRVIVIATTGSGNDLIFSEGPAGPANPNGLFVDYANEDGCDSPEPLADPDHRGTQVWRSDNFSDPWTWDLGVPPQPMYVRQSAAATTIVLGCSQDADETVTTESVPHGTKLVPFGALTAAVQRAQGYKSDGTRGERAQMGLGFTVLLEPGHYAERLRIDIPLRLANARSEQGHVRMGD